MARDPARRGLPAAAPHEPDLLPGQVLRLPDQADERAAEPRLRSRRCAACCPTCGSRCVRRRTRTRSRTTSWPTTAAGSTTTSSRPTTRRSGACPPRTISADWGAQRIKGMSILERRLGADPGQGSPAVAGQGQAGHQPDRGVPVPQVRPRHDVGALHRAGARPRAPRCSWRPGRAASGATPTAAATAVLRPTDGRRAVEYPADHVISSMPFPHLLRAMDPPPPAEVLAAADDLRFRDFLTVALVVPEAAGFPDNWIYIHSPDVKVGRIQNFGSWSPYLVKDGNTCLGLEYFVFEGDELWTAHRRGADRPWPPGARPARAWSTRPRSSRATWCGSPRRTPSTTTCYDDNVAVLQRAGSANTAQRAPGRAATACTSTTTRTTRCSRRC